MSRILNSNVESYAGRTIARLGLDDTTSYGPETVTITLKSDLIENGSVLKYSVHDFTNRGYSNSAVLSLSNAAVHVYAGNNLVENYFVPKNKVGTVWHVFEITEIVFNKSGN